jgi:putative ABC transport system permease protein
MRDWFYGLLNNRRASIVPAAMGVALAVCLLALLGVFIRQSAANMTERAVLGISPDWQVQMVGTTDTTLAEAAAKTIEGFKGLAVVDYADVISLSTTIDGTTQTTGAAKAVGMSANYVTELPKQLRLLSGSLTGVLLSQQTAANLHAVPGNTVSIARLGQPPLDVKIDGVVELPNADQLFQIVAATPQAARTAPPDNVILLPQNQWREAFQSQLENFSQTAARQLHVSFDHKVLPSSPTDAFVTVQEMANNLSAKLAGSGVIVNNLAARLDGVRQDSLFARVLFLFLGMPGAIIAVLLTVMIVLSTADRRRREIALLQLRGADQRQILKTLSIEACAVGIFGALVGLIAATMLAPIFVKGPLTANDSIWFLCAGAAGLAASLLVFLIPSWFALRKSALDNAAQARLLTKPKPAWQKLMLDVLAVAAAWLVFWQVSATGYQVVAAPEGVATATVDYKAYAAPALLWIGCGLLLMRLFSLFLMKGAPFLKTALSPLAKDFAKPVSASMSRESGRITKGVVLVALAVSFATSTAIFNTTYEQQATVDATLTNGADVTVTGTIDNPASATLDMIRKVNGVAAAEPMQHRYAYVGNDLQDLYGIDPTTIAKATAMSNAYFGNADAKATLASLGANPDGVLVSDETVGDFQLKEGDTINLRLQFASDHAYHVVPFKFIGIAREFPTAPKDSFLIANAKYIANATGIPTSEIVLIKASIEPGQLSENLRKSLTDHKGLSVTDLGQAVHRIGSSLVAVDLRSLTGLELAFAIPLVAGAIGLIFALGLAERRRSFAILRALGATSQHLGAFLWSEALVVYVFGTAAGLALGWAIAWMLTKLMTQVFDPPPDTLFVPWNYLMVLCLAGLAAVSIAVLMQLRRTKEPLTSAMRAV